jgi:hypothetical protein
MVKNGSQQKMNPPTIIASVFAALVSILKRFTCALMFLLPIRLDITLGLCPSSHELGLGLGALSTLSQLLDLRDEALLRELSRCTRSWFSRLYRLVEVASFPLTE